MLVEGTGAALLHTQQKDLREKMSMLAEVAVVVRLRRVEVSGCPCETLSEKSASKAENYVERAKSPTGKRNGEGVCALVLYV